jgi:hypothetical protein
MNLNICRSGGIGEVGLSGLLFLSMEWILHLYKIPLTLKEWVGVMPLSFCKRDIYGYKVVASKYKFNVSGSFMMGERNQKMLGGGNPWVHKGNSLDKLGKSFLDCADEM